jgi:hypothetical protein
LLIENKLKELRTTQIYTDGISKMFHIARELCLEIKKMTKKEKEKKIFETFEKIWNDLSRSI